ncbi:uncharacterized protein [Mycetomoellerius zeteki]|uniref:uncharacterized protein n=1 Tax=Mycetomoellerius zeteki TaxID=64791 RepID=UPI00084E8DBA|nr:PREDICTED: uncharacterized protein LOC108724040 [Trachymyrmex zeteki]
MEKATTDKSQRSVLEIADINEKVENNNVLMLNPLESVRSPSNYNSNDFLITAKGGNNICTNFEKTDPRATSFPREHDITSDSFSEDDTKDLDHSHELSDSTSSKSIETATTSTMCAKQIDKLSPIQVMKLQYEKLCVIEKTNTKLQTTVEEVASFY